MSSEDMDMDSPIEIKIKPSEKDALRNIILLGCSFLLLFTAIVTTGNIMQIILKTIQKEDPSFTGDGYISLAIVYGVFAFANIFAPSIVAILKAKATLILCSCFYVVFIVNLLFTTTWSLYMVSTSLGLAAAGLWTAQGNFLTLNSTKETISRNTGIFWVFFCSSQFLGNGFVFWQFFGKSDIDPETRYVVLGFLTCIGIGAIISLCFLQNTTQPQHLNSNSRSRLENKSQGQGQGPVSAFIESLKLLRERQMQLLILPFLFLGINQSFFASVYPTSLGFTKQFGTISKSLAGLSGICTGTGGLIGGGFVLLFGARINQKFGRISLVGAGAGLLISAYVLVYFNIPYEAPLGPTDTLSYLDPPSPVLGMICSVLLGFGDSFLHTQIYGLLSMTWQDKSAGAFATFHFFKSCALASQFFLSTQFGILEQLIMLFVSCLLSLMSFSLAERHMKRLNDRENTSNQNSNPNGEIVALKELDDNDK